MAGLLLRRSFVSAHVMTSSFLNSQRQTSLPIQLVSLSPRHAWLSVSRCLHYSNPSRNVASPPTSNGLPIDGGLLTIPNFLCISRIAATPYLCHLILQGEYSFAGYLFAAAGVTDFLDGQIAKNIPGQSSRLGSVLDPLADKILMTAVVYAMWHQELLPTALSALMIGRDFALVGGAAYLVKKSPGTSTRDLSRSMRDAYSTLQAKGPEDGDRKPLINTLRVNPLLMSKVNTAFSMVLVFCTLLWPVNNGIWHVPLCWGVGITTWMSGWEYLQLARQGKGQSVIESE
jgi:cardiolipin synthase (CMP-forming)